MKREAIQGALICLSVKFRIPVLRSISPEETVKLMISSYKQIANDGACRKHLPHRPVAYKRSNRLKQQVFILQGLPGIGPSKAQILLDKFGTLQAIFSASIPDLRVVEGIGKYTAEKIYSIVNDDSQPYLTRSHSLTGAANSFAAFSLTGLNFFYFGVTNLVTISYLWI